MSKRASSASPETLCELLGVERPVILAPMAKISGGALAAAVSNNGGLGLIGGGYGDLAWIDDQFRIAGDARVGVGLITWNMAAGALDGVLRHRPVAVWLSFGDPSAHIAAIHDAGAVAICQVGTVAEALSAADSGADIVAVQGSEAGGHGRPDHGLFGLLRAISAAIPSTPLVACGGINDQAGLSAAITSGAAGVAMGTAFYASTEALDVAAAKQHIVDARSSDTLHSRVYDHVRGPLWPEQYTARTIRTRLTDKWAGRETELAEVIEPVRTQHEDAVAANDMSVRVVFAGSGLAAIQAIRPASEITCRFDRVRTQQ